MSVPAVTFEAVGKSFYGVRVLEDVSFELAEGEVLGLIGENGAGKSTLMNILGGVLSPDEGELRLYGHDYAPASPRDASVRGIAFIHQELNLFTNLSIAENLLIDGFPRRRGSPLMDRRAVRSYAAAALERVGLDVHPDTPVERLPVGERQLVEIAAALGRNARVIIFDEPTTSLTARESERLFDLIDRLRGEGRGIVYISHTLRDVDRLADRVVVLRDGRVVGSGAREDFDVRRMISLMVGRSIDQLYPEREAEPGEEAVLDVKGVAQTGIVEGIDLTVRRGEVVGIFGLMGSGRTELARILFGLDGHETGRIAVAGRPLRRADPRRSIRQGMAFVTENRRDEGLLMDIAIRDNVALASLRRFAKAGLVDDNRLSTHVRQLAESLRIRASDLRRQPARSLSGGNQQKVVLAKWLATQPAVFILDEPTRGVDVGARYELYTAINEMAAQGTGILMISSELEELTGMCDRIVVMHLGEIVHEAARDEFDAERLLTAAFGEMVAS